jgi:hypothetical protein
MYDDGKILLGREVLASFEDTLATVIHEHAHFLGSGGGNHAKEVTTIWKKVVSVLTGRSPTPATRMSVPTEPMPMLHDDGGDVADIDADADAVF